MYGNTGMWDIYNPLMAQEWADTDKRIREYETVKEMYPESMQFIAQCVSDECDKYEYAASFIYDEYPDRFQLERMVKRIEKKVREEDALVQKEGDSVEDIQANALPPGGFGPGGFGPGGPGGFGPGGFGPGGPGPCRPGAPCGPGPVRPGRPGNFPEPLDDVIRILLYNEIYGRRCRNCRRRW